MSNHPPYINNTQQYSASHPHTSYSPSPTPQGYQTPQADMSQQAYAYYQQQNYAQNTQLQPNPSLPASTLHPLPFQGYSAHPSQADVTHARVPAHLPSTNYPPVQQQTYTGFSPSAYPSPSPSSYSQHPQQGYSAPSAYAHQRDSSSSTMPSSPSQSSQSSQSPAVTDRFPCPHCDKSFTRNFDRKRHMEIHIPGSSGSNRCRYCHKDYSRPDSLKRHLDNGCEKNPHP
ncbi:hypothetical protein EW145_g4004 [Phellinidium pouzarii]|uniref:C2H2-type domain-containing protein n=1 Tax=Phellinidium pouzarii TaxID=167371 RepID=A0A4S4L537_9AGAM|nr:hypothetical protein EW145_g4004 [Phellinidium pouzarii]